MIHVAYRLWGGDGFYAKMCGTSMLSMFENTKEKVTVHIMHNERLTPDNRGKFCYIAGQYNQQVEFHNVEEIAGASLRKFEAAHPLDGTRHTNALWYEFITHEVFPNLDKLIFFGADTVINLDISELWAYDLNEIGFELAAVPEISTYVPNFHKITVDGVVKYADYFNADVLMFNPSFFRKNFELILDGCKFIYNSKRYTTLDQDVLCYLFSKKYFKLPNKFNLLVGNIRNKKEFSPSKKAIYHFAGGIHAKPSINTDDVYFKLYLEYFLKTPWATVDMFGNIDKAFRRQYDLVKRELLRYTNFIGKRERVFLVSKDNVDKMRRIFEIKDDELVVDVSDLEARRKFLETANELKEKYLIYALHHDWAAIKSGLREKNLIEGKDFFDARIILSAKDGGVYLLYDPREVLREM